ncbi:MAG: hypothetical protein PHU71_03430 [Candidatus Gracilibacteria bacterium]|nr:hypothetical protein [Candidatus Gracilibacteria bacterium]
MDLIDNLEDTSRKLTGADFRTLSNALSAQIFELQRVMKCEHNSFGEKKFLSLDEITEYQDKMRKRLRVMILCLQNSMKLPNIDSLDIFKYRDWQEVMKLIFELETKLHFSISSEIKTQVVKEFWETSDLGVREKIRKIFAAFEKWKQEGSPKQTFTISLVKPVHRIQDSQP